MGRRTWLWITQQVFGFINLSLSVKPLCSPRFGNGREWGPRQPVARGGQTCQRAESASTLPRARQ
ncbi:hypothetical protein THICB2_240019 [Thiomonas sp. CB2]|nr:hypothetical protein THICB2_240019 [Thiomonas sp. CB2]VDY05545.1 protein of unknown function [Thiomonas sp. Bio17B3]VDY07291.1 protein of unknown function [Thiomonas sp. Sup16B3]VDY13799.1 conserved protein of unknown function [Thiomonas sp. OC7]VDY17001.1 protein of unknown function [Thiomonas sp. CB2]